MIRRHVPARVPEDAPNVVIIMLDDVGFGQAGTFGGAVDTPTLDRIVADGISYTRFHTTALCSPTRASLMTGRNHHRVGNGVITEMAMDWDGYVGTIPRTAATLPKVLKEYGYNTSAFGKWHNTPAVETTTMGPFTNWPTGPVIGFDYFYGFLAGETSQWEPRLVENRNQVEPPHDDPTYHLSEDMAQKAIEWLQQHQSYSPDKPFFLYFAPGAAHGPHHVGKDWADKYAGRFDQGWEQLSNEVFARQKEQGWIPSDARKTPRPAFIPPWESIPESQRPFQSRLMEVFAGFVEHADVQAGKVIDEIERQGLLDNTLVFYLFGDNGAATAGQNGSISELLFQNGIDTTIEDQLAALEKLGGIEVIGSAKTDNMYHAGWAWAGNTPFQYMKQVASHLGGTRNPMAVSWPAKITPEKSPRTQFTHVTDIVPTIYEAIGITAPDVVDGHKQMPLDGDSFYASFENADAPSQKQTQYFEMYGNMGIYHDGWLASSLGPTQDANLRKHGENWDPAQNEWELYDLRSDFTQAENLADQHPDRTEAMSELFMSEARENKVFPIGGSLWVQLHPEDRIATPYTEWEFSASTRRMPEFTAPALGRASNTVVIKADVAEDATGVLYALGGFSGGLAAFMDEGRIGFEYNTLMIERSSALSEKKVPAGERTIEIVTRMDGPKGPAEIVINVDGEEYAALAVERTVPLAFTASETFDVGIDLGSPVSTVYCDRRPFEFNGDIRSVNVSLDD
ncbi:arylsulfatase [Rhodobacteraceae bacterium F11138]|nr:arylsulfatase [Rhodobacteraceae bacterium F11138]